MAYHTHLMLLDLMTLIISGEDCNTITQIHYIQILCQVTVENIEVISDICNVAGICASANYAKNSFLNCVVAGHGSGAV